LGVSIGWPWKCTPKYFTLPPIVTSPLCVWEVKSGAVKFVASRNEKTLSLLRNSKALTHKNVVAGKCVRANFATRMSERERGCNDSHPMPRHLYRQVICCLDTHSPRVHTHRAGEIACTAFLVLILIGLSFSHSLGQHRSR
jgi:hypothetical protein